MALLFDCSLDVHEMRSLLCEQLPDIRWKLGDSEHEGFYLLGHTETGIRIKITEESDADGSAPSVSSPSGSRKYHLGVHYFASQEDLGQSGRLVKTTALQRRILQAISSIRSG